MKTKNAQAALPPSAREAFRALLDQLIEAEMAKYDLSELEKKPGFLARIMKKGRKHGR